jgi:hypothetical protein
VTGSMGRAAFVSLIFAAYTFLDLAHDMLVVFGRALLNDIVPLPPSSASGSDNDESTNHASTISARVPLSPRHDHMFVPHSSGSPARLTLDAAADTGTGFSSAYQDARQKRLNRGSNAMFLRGAATQDSEAAQQSQQNAEPAALNAEEASSRFTALQMAGRALGFFVGTFSLVLCVPRGVSIV